ncbi:hypothetical protein S100390_v1c02840 [Spiroplasma sp. NBRC 100390]|uniref:hypothetical protein n=1 Tax=unclassified Spiroplasma TaxID=2637901 RepID=UPI00089293A6|nr:MULTISPECIES: hypothetical protein [unclassified Spiroplasma]AOX43627.1 hypothetical protein STU14_v1c02840 [Spiroplasma sp. TU-14]APE13097.1 hypothetical protein S100390_v1c02840 [Spiroplasma sp. NBRC 100390]
MIKEDKTNNILKSSSPIRRKLSRKTNLKIFAIIGTVAIAAGLGGVIYSVVAPSSYHNKNPWANATLLDNKITRMINLQLSKPLIDLNGDPDPKHLPTYVSFNVGEKDGIDIYANLDNIKIIQEIFAKKDWIKNNLSIVETMLQGTGAILSGTQIIYQGNRLNLILRPKILTYPYNDDDKYGLVTVTPVDKDRGLFTYKIRFALQLIGTDNVGYYVDLNKTFDYTYDTTQATTPTWLNLSQMLNLMSNSKIAMLVQKYGIALDTSNETILNALLTEYYPMAKDDNSIIINEQVVNKDGAPFAAITDNPSASNLVLNVKYNSKKFNSLQQFGASLFDYHRNNYGAIANIFTKIGIKMPTFTNVKNSYDLYDRNTDQTFLNGAMRNERVNSYQGYIKEMGLESDNVSDNFDYENNDFSQYVWGSEHQIFYNEVLIQFLNINNNGLPDKVNRDPTKMYYDQQSYTDRSINYQEFNLVDNVKDVIENVQYDDSEREIDLRLTNKITAIKTSLKSYLLEKLNNQYININNIVKDITVGVGANATTIMGTSFNKQPPINGMLRGNNNKVYQDKLLSLPKIIIKVQFSYDGTIGNLYDLSYEYEIPTKVVKDPRGVDKNSLSVLQSNFALSKRYTTLDSTKELYNDYQQTITQVANEWEHNHPTGSGQPGDNYPVEISRSNSFNIAVNEVRVGRYNNTNLRVGTYNATIVATKDSLNYQGSFKTGVIHVTAAPISAISLSHLVVDSSWTQQDVYREIQRRILAQARSRGLNLNESDFRISGISENSLIKLRTGNKTITITALGNDNVVTGMATFNLIVNPVSISKYYDKTNPGAQKVGSSVQNVISIIMNQLKEAINKDGYNINDIINYFTIVITDTNGRRLNDSDIFQTPGTYWYDIEVTAMGGSKYFNGIIQHIFVVEK